jgi:hypothetical protein
MGAVDLAFSQDLHQFLVFPFEVAKSTVLVIDFLRGLFTIGTADDRLFVHFFNVAEQLIVALFGLWND